MRLTDSCTPARDDLLWRKAPSPGTLNIAPARKHALMHESANAGHKTMRNALWTSCFETRPKPTDNRWISRAMRTSGRWNGERNVFLVQRNHRSLLLLYPFIRYYCHAILHIHQYRKGYEKKLKHRRFSLCWNILQLQIPNYSSGRWQSANKIFSVWNLGLDKWLRNEKYWQWKSEMLV